MEKSLEQKVADLEEEEVLKLVQREIDLGKDPGDILSACQKGMEVVGERYSQGEYFVSDLMMAGEIFKEVSAMLSSRLAGKPVPTKGKVVFGTVKGDIHDIGKDLVVGILRSVGYEVTDLGVDVSPERFVEAVREKMAPVLGLSGLLTIAFDSMKETIEALKNAGLRSQTKVMVGGGPVNDEVRKYTGADGWGNDAPAAVNLCKEWIS
jgi:methylmalonyl-CoA mutase cobalamin-binding domain/chain